ncbi:cytochrome P450 10-like [Clavelina lepadiformis]|uniref:cytochrome P450 10-like n=1 Tax=Clavelina lepadiformis TaxID=159417 RepID=UPI004042B21A
MHRIVNQLGKGSYNGINRLPVRRGQTATHIQDLEPKPFSAIPEPRKLPLLGTAFDYRKFEPKQFHKRVLKRHQELGPIYKETVLPGMTPTIVFTSSSDDLQKMLKIHASMPQRGEMKFLKKARESFGFHGGVASVNGEEWYKMRKQINEHFLNTESVWTYAKEHYEVSKDFADFIQNNLNEENEVPDFRLAMQRWAFEAACVFVLETRCGTLSGEVTENVKVIIDSTSDILVGFVPLFFGLPLWKYFPPKILRLSKRQYLIKCLLFEDIEKTCSMKRTPVIYQGWRKLCMKVPLLQQESILADFLGGGIVTTQHAAAFALYCLANNPEKQEVLRKEIKEFKKKDNISGKTLQGLKYLHACVRETQRLFPLTLGFSRIIPKDLILSGYLVPKDTLVLNVGNIMNNRDERFFKDPDEFLPERWLTSREPSSRFAMSGSFGQGPRMCPGRRFAMQELNCLLVALLDKFHIEYHHKPFELEFQALFAPSEDPQFTFIPLEK